MPTDDVLDKVLTLVAVQYGKDFQVYRHRVEGGDELVLKVVLGHIIVPDEVLAKEPLMGEVGALEALLKQLKLGGGMVKILNLKWWGHEKERWAELTSSGKPGPISIGYGILTCGCGNELNIQKGKGQCGRCRLGWEFDGEELKIEKGKYGRKNNESRLEKMIDFDEMTAGAELDRLMANALGWKQLSSRLWHDANEHERWIDSDASFPHQPCWSPSTNIADAWEMVESLLQQGIEVVICGGFSGNLSACMLYQGGAASYPSRDSFLHLAEIEGSRLCLGGLVIRTQAKTVSLAICYAALEYEKDRLRRR